MDSLQHALSSEAPSSASSSADRGTPLSKRPQQPQKAGDLIGKVADIVERARKANRKPLPGTPLPRNVTQLPLWPEAVRAVPNGLLRSALFAAMQNGARRYMERELVAALDGLEIRYTGQRLDQDDLDAYESVLHAARLQPLGEQCKVTAYALLKLQGVTDTGRNRDLLEERLTRLRANAIEIKQEQCHYIGGLIDEAFKDSKTKQWVVVLNPRLGALFADDQFTQIDWAVRHALNNHPLAQWLHGFYASHARPYDMYVRTLHKLCGSGAARMDHFRDTLRGALNAVAIASQAHGQPFDYEIRRDGLVKVKKTPTKTQRRHLAKKAARLTAKHA